LLKTQSTLTGSKTNFTIDKAGEIRYSESIPKKGTVFKSHAQLLI